MRDDIPFCITSDVILEEFGIGMVTDSQEKTVNGNIYQLFIGLALALYQMSTFYPVFSEEADSIMFVQNLDVLALHHALLHHF